MKKFVREIIGSEARFSFGQRIFHFAVLLGVILTAFGTLLDTYYRANSIIDFMFTCFWALAYCLARFTGYFKPVSYLAFAVLVLAFLPYQWIMSGGIASAISYYPIIFLATVCIVLSGRFRTIMTAATILAVFLLIWYDFRRFDYFAPVVQRQINPIDFAIHLMIVMLSMAVLLIVFSNTYLKEKERSEAYARAVKQNYQQQLYYMETLEGAIDKLKSERHDFNNRLGVIYGLLEQGESDKAKAYAATLIRAAEEYRNIVNLPYSMLRAMLNYKLSAARERGIALRLDVCVPEGLELEEADLTVILGNLLDNAMEACDALDQEHRFLMLSLLYKPDYLVIQMENPVVGEPAARDEMARTSKPDRDNHGFGLRNIEYLVSKHNGMMRLEPEPGLYKMNLALLVNNKTQ